MRSSSASGPEICCGELESRFDHLVGKTELAVELQGPRLHCQRSRGRAGFGRSVDDAHPDAEPGEPESEREAGRSGADDENLGVHPGKLTPVASTSSDHGVMTIQNSRQ